MGTLSVANIYRQITNHGKHAVDFSGPLMLIVQKITYIAYDLHDGLAREEIKLSDEQRREKLRKVPSLLEYFSYLFHFSMILAGPVCTFREFNDFIDGSDIRPKKPGEKEPSPLMDVIKKMSSGFLCIFILFFTEADFPIAKNAAEAVNNMCGLGFNGYDENGKAKWDRVTNVNILKMEFAASMKMVFDNWNISTALWLRRVAEFIRPYFQKTRALAFIYDVITCIVTCLCVADGAVAFELLEFRLSIDYWRETLIIVGLSTVCYILTAVINPTVVHRFVFIAAMGTLSVANIYRQITNYGKHAVDFSGPLMLIVQKITYIAYDLHDGLAREESTLTDEQRKEKLRKVPSLLEYFSYLFHFSMILAGPVCTFREFNDFIDGSDIRPKKPGEKEPSPLMDVIKKMSSGFLCVFILFLTEADFPIAKNADPKFITSQPLYWRVIYSCISGTVSKLRYYFAFKVAEAVNNMCGLGFNGYDENGKAKWNRVTNVNILKMEFATSMKMACDNWNISTALWLRRTVYERSSRHRTVAVFITSSLWHGFYPGYYMMFMSIGLMIEAGRMGHRVIRPYFQKTRALAFIYDVITCMVTCLCVAEGGVPFQLLELRLSIEYWRWVLVLLCRIFGGLLLYVILSEYRTRSRHKESPRKTDSNRNWINKLDTEEQVQRFNQAAKKLKLN
ncbi:Lysophospholipid acyltransferase 1 [Desmophyllum pertusum]|uniref:Lysophospholipid acyltransferase 1 n=1 Tax=Desmophyllum pertusum TaxID=174260 RepID=A0A9X0CMW1_9CNID|nr:Lysophospholipid acyltransferase 1 [Desmophyllum pertusum]